MFNLLHQGLNYTTHHKSGGVFGAVLMLFYLQGVWLPQHRWGVYNAVLKLFCLCTWSLTSPGIFWCCSVYRESHLPSIGEVCTMLLEAFLFTPIQHKWDAALMLFCLHVWPVVDVNIMSIMAAVTTLHPLYKTCYCDHLWKVKIAQGIRCCWAMTKRPY